MQAFSKQVPLNELKKKLKVLKKFDYQVDCLFLFF